MRLLQFFYEGNITLGVKTEQGILHVKKAGQVLNVDVPTTLKEAVTHSTRLETLVDQALQQNEASSLFLNESELELSPAITDPEKIICVGLNYADHAEESKMALPETPILFSKFNNSLAAHNEEIRIPNVVHKCDYEAEMVVVIGKEASEVSEEEALSYIYGYAVGNDLSARDLQMKTGQWLLGKSLDRFAPIGPYVVTADQVDPSNLKIECTVNGEVRQSSSTKHLIFDCAHLISYISHHMTLQPGDVIFTGTPEGVMLGYPEGEQQWLKAGDVMSVTIEGLGTLENKLV